MTITILLPVYGRSPWLKQALTSIQNQTSGDWNLVIADDGSDEAAQLCIQHWLYEQNSNQITWNKRPKNLGLFKNLNQAIKETKTEFISSYPSCEFFSNNQNLNNLELLFLKGNKSSFFERILTQIFMIFGRAGSEGGLFFFLGKKNQ